VHRRFDSVKATVGNETIELGALHQWACALCGRVQYTPTSWPPAGWVEAEIRTAHENENGEHESRTYSYPDLCPRCAVNLSVSDLIVVEREVARGKRDG